MYIEVSLEGSREEEVSCPGSPSQQVAELRCEPRISDARWCVSSWPGDPGEGFLRQSQVGAGDPSVAQSSQQSSLV